MQLNKIPELTDRIIKLLNKSELNPSEYSEILGRLLFITGASLAGYKEAETPSIELIKAYYLSDPTLDLAMMLSGIQVLEWSDTFQSKPVLSNIGNIQRKKE